MFITDPDFKYTLRGTLDEATARRDDQVGLTTLDGKAVTLWVREGMDDLVRAYFKRAVEVRVEHRNGRTELGSITNIEEEMIDQEY